VKCVTPAEQSVYVEQADLVIWAAGYQTSKINIKDTDNKPIGLQ
jgi:hypothetical protein